MDPEYTTPVVPIEVDDECAGIAEMDIKKIRAEKQKARAKKLRGLKKDMKKAIEKNNNEVKTDNPTEGPNSFCCCGTFEETGHAYSWDELCENGFSQYECQTYCHFPLDT